jgi:hypothetical protein
MKILFTIIIVSLIASGFYSCKNTGVYPASSIVGEWNIKVDSVETGIGPLDTTEVYIGKSGDYYDFRPDSKLYIKEGATLDTFAYKVVAANKVTISIVGSANIFENCFIDAINPASATINFEPYLFNPGGNTTSRVYLTR